jgi:tRNA threonylcarbamoyladenosine biosynthesis protein TsaB
MRTVAIDTTGAFGSIALRENGHTLEEVPLHSSEGFSQVLFGHLERLLARHEWNLSKIGCFAAASGPGSFTGLRVGLVAIKGLAEASGAKAIGVSNLQALAAFGKTARRGVVIDARRGEIYAAIYDSNLRAVTPEIVLPPEQWLNSLDTPPEEIIATDLSPFTTLLPGIPATEQRTLAAAVAQIAESNLSAGASGDPLLVDANYVRRSDAELFWRD